MSTHKRDERIEVHILHDKGDGKPCDPMCGFAVVQRLTIMVTPPITIDESMVRLPDDISSWDTGSADPTSEKPND